MSSLLPVDEEPSQLGQEKEDTSGLEEEEEEDAEVTPNEGAEDTITIMAHVRDKIIPVHCGFGTQQVVWLGHVAIARYDEEGQTQGWMELGIPTKVIKDGKRELGLTDVICDVLQDRNHVYISTSLVHYVALGRGANPPKANSSGKLSTLWLCGTPLTGSLPPTPAKL
ncbi:hypothetical protein PF005_g14411 [Phytophthora fragariae]|uniref:Uncharacterized protein n=1 Tax=Phytophthora fragariae TaxID=53985 RepID=A0A6A3XRU0_9STRA|nr:hypothetical protein PF009_g15796 [Phytophthora fragariae]KAE9102482.1 hypothetical protein PF010_g14087 [Phytophthora fragariae]KAE9124398.1 hypothetical protein PF007_g6741 [Phytophthora fragariae]KAE9148996.1 hypothetical protein PF006_g6471 [Phytophthora fragariae]KAE9202863.1 hypothetical protein PF005_g14411 [Phytophthora fragariae]